jgi:Mn-dependent DtxR family transcriptional regulator
MKLSEHEQECLSALIAVNDHPRHPMKWARPLDLGGSNGSYHSNTLNRLAKKGLVNFRFREGVEPAEGENGKRFFASRGAKLYRINDAGRAAITTKGSSG